MINVLYKSCKENRNKNFMFSSLFGNGAVYEIMWKNIVEPGRPQMTIWCTRIAFWILNSTNIH